MNAPIDFKDPHDKIVYVRPVDVAELPDDIRAQVQGQSRLYAVHNESGERLALVKNRYMAFALARQNDMKPLTVH